MEAAKNGRALSFLVHPQIEPTNNRAERALQGTVIAKALANLINGMPMPHPVAR